MAFEQFCLHCMSGYLDGHGICRRCRMPSGNPNRNPDALPYGFPLRQGRYRLGDILGQGGFGITYQAWDAKQRRRVALKEFFPRGAVVRDPVSHIQRLVTHEDGSVWAGYYDHVKQRFYDEAQTIYKLRDIPEIFTIYDYFEELNTAFYSMEFLEGETLGEMARSMGHVTWPKIAPYIWDVTRSLEMIHRKDQIHRDVSPDNIFIQRNNQAKLIDFGSVRNFKTANRFTGIFKAPLAAPEMFDDTNQGPWSDVFALCASIYYLLSDGKTPRHVYSRLADLNLQGKDSLVPLENYAGELPDYICGAVMRGMALHKEDRIPNMTAFQEAFFPEGPPPERRIARTVPLKRKTDGYIHGVLCTRGRMIGMSFDIPVGESVRMGRREKPETGWIAFPMNWRGVSRKQCELYRDKYGNLLVRDLNSAFGTLLDGVRLRPNKWERMMADQTLEFGNEQFRTLG